MREIIPAKLQVCPLMIFDKLGHHGCASFPVKNAAGENVKHQYYRCIYCNPMRIDMEFTHVIEKGFVVRRQCPMNFGIKEASLRVGMLNKKRKKDIDSYITGFH